MKDFARVIIEFGHDPEFKEIKDTNLDIFKKISAERFHIPLDYGEPAWVMLKKYAKWCIGE